MIDIGETDTATAIHVVLIFIWDDNRVVFFLEPSLGNLDPALLLIVLGLNHLAIDIKHVDFFSCEVQVGVGRLFLVVEVETHFHEAIIDFAWVEVDVEGVLDRLMLD